MGDLFIKEDNDDDDEFSDFEIGVNIKRAVTPFKRMTISDLQINKNIEILCLSDLIVALDVPNSSMKQVELLKVLIELNEMIGLKTLKEQIVNQLLFFIQDLHDPGMFLHTVITGNPGAGKTTVAQIMARIYRTLGILHNDTIVVATRADLIGEYLGSTSIKTKAVLDSSLGGILFIDEVYSLGSSDGRDSFSKECIDTINQYLSEHSEELICIISGYKDSIDKCFFNQNPGLKRRFPWKFHIDDYSPSELYQIFHKQIYDNKWELDVPKEFVTSQIQKNIKYFSSSGGDTQILCDRCKIIHSRRIFGSNVNKIISKDDFVKGLENFLLFKKSHEVIQENSMYI